MDNNIREKEHTITVPKYDNSGRKIRPEVIKKYSNLLSERFGGVTIYPSVLGCWVDKGIQYCEENIILRANRDLDKIKDLKRRKIIKKDRAFIKKLSKDIGMDLGQEVVLTSEDNVEVSYRKGLKREELEKEKIGADWFEKLI